MAQDHAVHEAFGPPLSPLEAASSIALGAVALLMAGVVAEMLGQLADEGRLGAQSIGFVASLEGITMAVSTGLAGILIKPRNLRWIGAVAAAVLVATDLASMWTSGAGVYAVRFLAGIPEGILLWLTVNMIARTEVPERWSAVFFTAFVGAQLVLALACWAYVMPRWGANGGLAALAACSLPALYFAFRAPDSFAPLPKPEGETGSPPIRGWVALLATLFLAGAAPAVGTFLQPLAHQSGLSADVAREAVWVSLVAQVAGGVTATALAGRIHYLTVFIFTGLGLLACWAVIDFVIPAWAFVSANALGGYAAVALGPFLVPMTIEADPSRRAAVLSASTQVLAGSLAPFAAGLSVRQGNAHGSLLVGVAFLFAGLLVVAGLHFHAVRLRTHAPAA
ncbi:MAG TPA: hypothetical protein VMH86_04735 [Rhizomicrobium sp.]|nr:hypothetical protein [Rhizomicrobium sp.]